MFRRAKRHLYWCDYDSDPEDLELIVQVPSDIDGIGVVVRLDGTVTNRWGDGTVGVPEDIVREATAEVEAGCPMCSTLYVWERG